YCQSADRAFHGEPVRRHAAATAVAVSRSGGCRGDDGRCDRLVQPGRLRANHATRGRRVRALPSLDRLHRRPGVSGVRHAPRLAPWSPARGRRAGARLNSRRNPEESAVSETVDALLGDMLAWLDRDAKPYGEVMDAWRTSCPRLPVWED